MFFAARRTSLHLARRSIPVVAVALILTLAGLGCGDDKQNDTNDTGTVDADTAGTTLELEGLSAPVTVRYDQWGVLHLDCETTRDCFIAQGYFHADDRFFQMDLIRRQTLGRLSTLIGLNLGLTSDEKFRQLMTTREGKPLEDAYLESMNDPTREMLDAYAKGVNAWLDDMRDGTNGASLSGIYDLSLIEKSNIPDWRPQDSVALYLQLAFQLSFSAPSDLFRGRAYAKLDNEVASDLFTVKPGIESNTLQAAGVQMPSSLPGGAGGTLDRVRKRLAPAHETMSRAYDKLTAAPSLVFGPNKSLNGSNNWVLGPDQTKKEGVTLLANDPHLTLSNPPIWYMVEMNAESGEQGGMHVAGGSIPAVPGVVAGHNEHVGWGVTTARLDLADAYNEQLTPDGSAVVRDGENVSLITKEFTFEGLDDATKTVEFEWVPGHGPLISKNTDQQTAVSVKWVAQGAGADFNFFLPLMRAESVDEAMSALQPIRTINQNWVIIDDKGSIGWNPAGAIPKRPWASPQTPNWLPLPGDGSAEWQGFVDESKAPKLTDPPNSFIATANNDMDGSYTDGDSTNDGHTPWQMPPAVGHRHKQIVNRIQAESGSHTAETMRKIQDDTHMLHGEKIVPPLLSALDNSNVSLSEGASKVARALRDWNYDCPTGLDGYDPEEAGKASGSAKEESIGCAAFHVLIPELTAAIFGDELEAAEAPGARDNVGKLQEAVLYIFADPGELNRGEEYFDDTSTADTEETKAEIVAEALDAAATKLQEAFGSNERDDWRWGRIHTVTFQNLLGNPVASDFNDGPYARDGGMSTVDVAPPTGGPGGPHSTRHGPSVRLVFRASSDGVQGWFQLPGGQVFDRDSPYYGSLAEDWLKNKSQKLLFTSDEVSGAAESSIRIEPAE